jgi:hypothetical protein
MRNNPLQRLFLRDIKGSGKAPVETGKESRMKEPYGKELATPALSHAPVMVTWRVKR